MKKPVDCGGSGDRVPDKAQAQLWSKPPYPPPTMVEVHRLFDDDIVEIDSVLYAPAKK
jgi:2-iminobutanoate/2-iminopropanoate deaminase